jgi:mevalonate kinase
VDVDVVTKAESELELQNGTGAVHAYAVGARGAVDPDRVVMPRPLSMAACGKAIIVGEHAVVYGARAVAMPVMTMQMSVKLTPTHAVDKAGQPLVRVYLGSRSVSDHLLGVVHDAFKLLDLPPYGVDIEGHSSVLIGAGLGSSASLCIVTLKALAAAAGRTLGARELAAAGNRLEARFHGNPSGLDTAVVACEQAISFVKGSEPQPIAVRRIPLAGAGAGSAPWRFALLDTGARSSTLSMIQVAAPYFAGEAGAARLNAFTALADRVVDGLGAGDPHAVADGMREAASRLDEAGVTSPRIREVMDAAYAAGVLAAKPTGAGGGGCVLALLAPESPDKTPDTQLAALRHSLGGARVFSVELG